MICLYNSRWWTELTANSWRLSHSQTACNQQLKPTAKPTEINEHVLYKRDVLFHMYSVFTLVATVKVLKPLTSENFLQLSLTWGIYRFYPLIPDCKTYPWINLTDINICLEDHPPYVYPIKICSNVHLNLSCVTAFKLTTLIESILVSCWLHQPSLIVFAVQNFPVISAVLAAYSWNLYTYNEIKKKCWHLALTLSQSSTTR